MKVDEYVFQRVTDDGWIDLTSSKEDVFAKVLPVGTRVIHRTWEVRNRILREWPND